MPWEAVTTVWGAIREDGRPSVTADGGIDMPNAAGHHAVLDGNARMAGLAVTDEGGMGATPESGNVHPPAGSGIAAGRQR
jgi:hypothetical protein